jgi:hypothetical protein
MFEQAINKSRLIDAKDKTFVDKILAKEDVEALKKLMKKPRLSREDMLEMLSLLGSTESKLLNYENHERYVLLKYFVWIREYVRQGEYLFDYEDFLKTKKIKLSLNAKRLLDNNRRLLEHNIKFLADLYMMIGRTSMSLNGSGFKEVITNKFELNYDQKAKIATTEGVK